MEEYIMNLEIIEKQNFTFKNKMVLIQKNYGIVRSKALKEWVRI